MSIKNLMNSKRLSFEGWLSTLGLNIAAVKCECCGAGQIIEYTLRDSGHLEELIDCGVSNIFDEQLACDRQDLQGEYLEIRAKEDRLMKARLEEAFTG